MLQGLELEQVQILTQVMLQLAEQVSDATSRGGRIALDLALDAPDRVRAVAVVCSNPSGFEGESTVGSRPDSSIVAHAPVNQVVA